MRENSRTISLFSWIYYQEIVMIQVEPVGNSAPLSDTEFYILGIAVALMVIIIGIRVINYLKGFSK